MVSTEAVTGVSFLFCVTRDLQEPLRHLSLWNLPAGAKQHPTHG